MIKDLEIEGFCTGIALAGSGANKVRNNTIEGCSIHDNGFNTISSGGSEMITHGIHACWIDAGDGGEPALTVKKNDIYDNEGTGSACGDGGNGIFIYPRVSENYCDIKSNRLHNNAKAGFWTKMMRIFNRTCLLAFVEWHSSRLPDFKPLDLLKIPVIGCDVCNPISLHRCKMHGII